MINSHWHDHKFVLPSSQSSEWFIAVDTGQPGPEEIYETGCEPGFLSADYLVRERSVLVLLKKRR
jgi:hypothetical protein